MLSRMQMLTGKVQTHQPTWWLPQSELGYGGVWVECRWSVRSDDGVCSGGLGGVAMENYVMGFGVERDGE